MTPHTILKTKEFAEFIKGATQSFKSIQSVIKN